MASYLPPTENLPIFNANVFPQNLATNSNSDIYLTRAEADKHYLQYPVIQPQGIGFANGTNQLTTICGYIINSSYCYFPIFCSMNNITIVQTNTFGNTDFEYVMVMPNYTIDITYSVLMIGVPAENYYYTTSCSNTSNFIQQYSIADNYSGNLNDATLYQIKVSYNGNVIDDYFSTAIQKITINQPTTTTPPLGVPSSSFQTGITYPVPSATPFVPIPTTSSGIPMRPVVLKNTTTN